MTFRFWTLLVLICLSVEKREFDISPLTNQFALAAVLPAGSHDAVVALGAADPNATTVAPRSTVPTARSKILRMLPLPPHDSYSPHVWRAPLVDAASIPGATCCDKGGTASRVGPKMAQ